jgi:hypothetical protein
MTTTHRIGTTAVLILSLAAAGAPAASAKHVEDPATAANPAPATVYSPQDKSIVPATSPSTTAGITAKVSAQPPVVTVQAPTNGFDWGDAGIGAAGALGLAMLALAGALAITQRRAHRPSGSARSTS